ncbi:MAG TPA: MarR family transcriptional regulator, partial [Xanthobacteraceae bacterium]|nr:MarR family transcriptional regulator [Xanthobacteraceae bacterium]
PLARDKLVSIEAGEDGRTRVVRLTPAGGKRAKAAAARWQEAQREFEAGYGKGEAARLRAELARVVAAT